MFDDLKLNVLILALNSKIADDIYQIEFWKKELSTYKNNHDYKYLNESKEILKRDIDLRDEIQDILYARKYKKDE